MPSRPGPIDWEPRPARKPLTPLRVVGRAATLVALVPLAMVAGVLALFSRPMKRTEPEVAWILNEFLAGTITTSEWDEFVSFEIIDPKLEAIRKRCKDLWRQFPAPEGQATSDGESAAIRELLAGLQVGDAPAA